VSEAKIKIYKGLTKRKESNSTTRTSLTALILVNWT